MMYNIVKRIYTEYTHTHTPQRTGVLTKMWMRRDDDVEYMTKFKYIFFALYTQWSSGGDDTAQTQASCIMQECVYPSSCRI